MEKKKNNKKKLLLILSLILVFCGALVSAVWYNPLTWEIFSSNEILLDEAGDTIDIFSKYKVNFIEYGENGYDYISNNTRYDFYIKENSNYGDGTKYCVEDNGEEYCLIYQAQDMSFRNKDGLQDYISSINGVVGTINESDKIIYENAFQNVDLSYFVDNSKIKELFILNNLTEIPESYLGENVTLDFGGYIKFDGLDIYANGKLQEKNSFITSNAIDFKNGNKTLFSLPKPYAYYYVENKNYTEDSLNEEFLKYETELQYEVKKSGNNIWFYVKTPYSFLQNATFPVYIDPSTLITGLASYTDLDGDFSIDGISSLSLSSDGNYLATSSSLGDTVSIFNITNKSEIIPLASYTDSDGDFSIDGIRSLSFSSDGNYLATSSNTDATVSIFNIANKSEIVPLASYTDSDGDFSIDSIRSLSFSSDGNYLATSSSLDDTVSIFNITNKSEIIPLASYADSDGDFSLDSISSLSLSSDGNYLATSSYFGDTVSIFNITNKSEIIPLASYTDSDGDFSIDGISSLSLSSDGNYLATSSNTDDTVSIFNIANKSEIVPLASYTDSDGDFSIDGIRSLSFSSDGNYLATSSNTDDTVSIMDLQDQSDTTLPTGSNAAHNNTIINEPTKFSILVNDETALESNGQYIFSTNNSGSWVNDSAVNFTSTPNWANVTKTLSSTGGISIGYMWYFTDNAGNANATVIQTLTTAGACSYTSGNWNVNCADNCVISSNINLGGNNLTLYGTGIFTLNANISNRDYIIKENACELIINTNGGLF